MTPSTLPDTESLRARIVKEKLPTHVAIIMDGNGRWAKKRGLKRSDGHKAGVKAARGIVEACGKLEIPYLTLYTFSVENWKRPRAEVNFLFKLLTDTARTELNDLIANNVRLIVTGQIEELPFSRRKAIEQAIKKTAHNTGLVLNLALNYGGRTEILEAVKKIARDYKSGKFRLKDIKEDVFESYLSTYPLPDPDLLIRTSGEQRLSNFLLWQTSYTELYITPVLWPDFEEREFVSAILDYQKRERRFGKL